MISIQNLSITGNDSNLQQELSFAAWGNLRDPETWSGEFDETPLLDRGFTGHGHLYNFGLINMNGRMYDPVMSSFLSVDNYVQQPDNSQNFIRYAYCLNNPLKYVDPSGEELCAAAVMAIAAAVSVATQCIQNYCYDRPIYQDLVKAAAIGAVQGMFSYGIGYVGQAITAAMDGAGRVACIIAFKAVAHGTLAGAATVASGGHFWQGFASGAASSLVSSCIGAACAHSCSVQWQRAAMIAGGALAGGVSATIAGGNFWDGVCNGLICAGLNHAMHLVVEGDGKLIKATLKNIERMKAIQQKGRISSPLNSATYEKMCKYADLEMVEKYLLGDKGRDQIRLSQDHPASDQSQFQFYEGCAKGRGYQVYELDFAVSQIAGALEQGCPIILWEWDVQGSKPINAHSLVVIGVEGVEGANFQMTVIDSEASKDNLIQIRNFNELRCNHSMVQFVK